MTPKGLATRRTSTRREAPRSSESVGADDSQGTSYASHISPSRSAIRCAPRFLGLVCGCIGLPPPNGNALNPATCAPCRGRHFLLVQKVTKDTPGRRKISNFFLLPGPLIYLKRPKGSCPFGLPAALRIRGFSFCLGFRKGHLMIVRWRIDAEKNG